MKLPGLFLTAASASLMLAGCMERAHDTPVAPMSAVKVQLSPELKSTMSKALGLTASSETLSVVAAHVALTCLDPAGNSHASVISYSEATPASAVAQVDRRWDSCRTQLTDITVNSMSGTTILNTYAFAPSSPIWDAVDGAYNTLTAGTAQITYITSRVMPTGYASDSSTYVIDYTYALEIESTSPSATNIAPPGSFGGISTTVPITVGFSGTDLPGVVVGSITENPSNGHLYANLVNSAGQPADATDGLDAYCPSGTGLYMSVNFGPSADTFATAVDLYNTATVSNGSPGTAPWDPNYIFTGSGSGALQYYQSSLQTNSVDISDLTTLYPGRVPGNNLLASLAAQCQGEVFTAAIVIGCGTSPQSYVAQTANIAVSSDAAGTQFTTNSCSPAFPSGQSSGSITPAVASGTTAQHLQITGPCLSVSDLAYIQANFPINATSEPTPLEAPCTGGSYTFDFSPSNYLTTDQAAFLGGTVTETTANNLVVATYAATSSAGTTLTPYAAFDTATLNSVANTESYFYYLLQSDLTGHSVSYMLENQTSGQFLNSSTTISQTGEISATPGTTPASIILIDSDTMGNLLGMSRQVPAVVQPQ